MIRITVVLLAFMACAQGRAAVPLDTQLSQLESSWTETSGVAQYHYFATASEIAARLSEQDRVLADPAAIRLLQALLSKNVRSVDVGAADLVAQLKVARFVIANRAREPQLQRAQTEALALLVQRMRSEIKIDYEPKPVYLNVAPPSGASPRIAGMNPEAIANSDDRDAYKSAILDNQANNLENTRQAELRRMNKELSEPVLAQIREQASSGGMSQQVLKQLLATPGLSMEEKSSLNAAAADARIAGR